MGTSGGTKGDTNGLGSIGLANCNSKVSGDFIVATLKSPETLELQLLQL